MIAAADLVAAITARQFTLDGRGFDIGDFIAANEFDSEDVEFIRALEVGQSIRYGGGAAAEFLLVRIA